MFRITIWLQLLLLVLILRQSDAVSDQCSELQNEISRLEGHILNRITELEHRNEILVSQNYVTGLQYDIVTCEWLLYCSRVVTVIKFYVAQCSVSGYYIFHVSPKTCSCIQLTKTLPIHGGNYGFCTTAVTLRHTASCPCSAVCPYLTAKLVSFWQIAELCNV